MINTRSVRAKLTLLGAVFKSLLVGLVLRLLGRPKNGARWLAALREEGLYPTPTHLWPMGEGTSRCLGCGMCDAVAQEQLSLFIQSAPRDPRDALLARSTLAPLEATAHQVAKVCPARVDVHAIGALIHARARQLAGEEESTS